MGQMIKRDLDGFYLRVNRDGKWCNLCFTDLTEEEQSKWLDRLFGEGLRSMVKAFCENIVAMSEMDLTDAELRVMAQDTAKLLRTFGDKYEIVNRYGEEE